MLENVNTKGFQEKSDVIKWKNKKLFCKTDFAEKEKKKQENNKMENMH